MWTNTSEPPASGVMKPKPFWELKNLTVPVAILASCGGASGVRRAKAARVATEVRYGLKLRPQGREETSMTNFD
jgi:hypothetical protein